MPLFALPSPQPIPLPPQVLHEQQRVATQSHGRVIVELGPRGRVPCQIPGCSGRLTSVAFHSRSVSGADTWGHYLADDFGGLMVWTHRWSIPARLTPSTVVDSPSHG